MQQDKYIVDNDASHMNKFNDAEQKTLDQFKYAKTSECVASRSTQIDLETCLLVPNDYMYQQSFIEFSILSMEHKL